MVSKSDNELPVVSRVQIERKLRRQRKWNRPGDYVHAIAGGFGFLLVPLQRTLVEPIVLERLPSPEGVTVRGAIYERHWLMWSTMYHRIIRTTSRQLHNCTTTGVK